MRTRTLRRTRLVPATLALAAMLALSACGRSAPEGETELGAAPDPAADAVTQETTSADPAVQTDGQANDQSMGDQAMAADNTTTTVTAAVVAVPILTPDNNTAIVDPSPNRAGVRITSENAIVAPAPAPTTSTTQPAPLGTAGVHLVQSGDTLSVIAEQYQISLQALVEANGISDADTIKPGQELIIPAAG